MRLADPAASRAVLIGCADYLELEPLPAIHNNLAELAELLQDGDLWGLPASHCTVLANPSTIDEVLDAVHAAAVAATDLLLVYYAGHGLLDQRSNLFLTLAGSSPIRLHKAVRYDDLRREVIDTAVCPAKVVILDCCFSGEAMAGGMSAGPTIADQARMEGTYLLTASEETKLASAPIGEEFTAFTGEIVRALRGGVTGGPDLLDLDTLYRHVRQELAAKGRPIPQQRARNDGRSLALVRNRRGDVVPKQDERSWMGRYLTMAPAQLAAAVTAIVDQGRDDEATAVLTELGRAWPEQELASLVAALRAGGPAPAVLPLLDAAATRRVEDVVELTRVLTEIGAGEDAGRLVRLVARRPPATVAAVYPALTEVDRARLLVAVTAEHDSPGSAVELAQAFMAAGHADVAERVLRRAAADDLSPEQAAALVAAGSGLGDLADVVLQLAARGFDNAGVCAVAVHLRAGGASDLAVGLLQATAPARGIEAVVEFARELREIGRPLGAIQLLENAAEQRTAADVAALLNVYAEDEPSARRILDAAARSTAAWPRSLDGADDRAESTELRPLFRALASLADGTGAGILPNLAAAEAWTSAAVLLHEVARQDVHRARRIGSELAARRVDSWQAALLDPVPATEEELVAVLGRLRPPAGRPWQQAVDLWRDGHLDAAERELRELVRRSRPDIRAAAAVTHAVLRRDEHNDLQTAQQLLEFASVHAGPGVRTIAQLHLAACHDAAGRPEQARAAYTEAMRSGGPQCAAEAALQLGWLLADAGDDDAAERVFEDGLAHEDPATAPWLQLGLGQLEHRAGRQRRAVAYWARAAKSTEPLAVGYSLLLRAQHYRGQGDDGKADTLTDRLMQTPGAEELWPFALEADVSLAIDIDTRIGMMGHWLTWLTATRSASVTFYDQGRRTARLVATFDGAGTVLFASLPAHGRLGGRRSAGLREYLAAEGFRETDDSPDDQPAGIAAWVARNSTPDRDPYTLARKCETIFGHGYRLPSDFHLGIQWSSDIPLEPLPRPLLPQLLP
ncbi:caspase family protein [Dactylosporangium vinaceum]|uniref:Caspase family protein n=1 Tax=Dactylosporangium vinaceum TaxID=53362 RepID=A0ABV5MJT9_9ACTN|nr:caspase family protein [Dactylosporangium vinaceum]UAB93693.1 caspase family protein [Dactylosporangium vinaceum]